MATQLARQGSLPADRYDHWATGAIEEAPALVHAVIGDRAGMLRNGRRMNLLLELVRLRISKRGSAVGYAIAIRNDRIADGGRPVHTARMADPGGGYSLQPRIRPQAGRY